MSRGGIIFFLASCENFLSGGDFKNQLNMDVTYAESPFYEIRLECREEAGNIIIRPVCLCHPELTDFYPPYNPSGYEQNSPVKITFNKPMNAETFADFSCVSIYIESMTLFLNTRR